MKTIPFWWIVHGIRWWKKGKEKQKQIEEQAKKKLEEEEKTRGPLPEEEKIKFLEAEKFRSTLDAILEENPKLRNEIEQLKEQVQDPLIKRYIEELLREEEKSPAHKGVLTILYGAIKHAIQQGLHQDREKFFNYIASTLLHTTHELSKETTHLDEEYMQEKYGEDTAFTFEGLTDPASAIQWYLSGILRDIKKEMDEAKQYYRHYRELQRTLYDVKEKAGIERWGQNPALAYATLTTELRGTPHEEVLRRPEEILGITPEEEEEEGKRIAPQIMARAVEERLPGAAYRLATLIHAVEEGKITPQQAIEYLEQLHSPHSPHGTALYNIIHHLINLYEEKIARGEPIPPPSEAIKRVLHKAGLPPYRDPEEILREAEEQRIHPRWITAKLNLGIPLPPSRAARAVRSLIENLRRLENGEDPEELDTKQELSLLARIIKEDPHPAGPQEIKERILLPYLWDDVFYIAFEELFRKAHHLGREEEEKLLNDMRKIVFQHIKEASYNTPYYKIIADAIKRVHKELREKGYDEKDAAWAANVAQHLLLTLPFHVVEGPHEHPKLKALLLEGYTPEEHENPPIVRGIYNFYRRINEAKTDEEKKALLARFRDSFNTLETLKSSVHRTIQSLKMEKVNEPRKIASAFLHTIRPISRAVR